MSIAGHPFVTALVLAGTGDAREPAGAAARRVAVVALLFVLPLALLIARQVRRGAWSTVDASRPQERPALFLVGGAGLLALLGYFALTRPGSPAVRGTAAVVAMVLLCAALTPWIKLSLHMAAAALAAAVLLGRGSPLGWLFGAALPILGWSRVALGRHRWAEVALGLLIGACTGIVVAHL